MLALLALLGSVDLRPPNLTQCTPALARHVTVEELAGRPKRYGGQCVSVTGPTWTVRMYSGVEGIYLSTRPAADGAVPAANLSHRIGLYFGEKLDREEPEVRDRLNERFTALSVTGVADSCSAMAGRLPPAGRRTVDSDGEVTFTMHMLGGYCHYDGGAVVWVARRTIASRRPYLRLRGGAARRRYGDLVPAPRGWRHAAETRRFAEKLRKAIAIGDRSGVSRLFGGASPDDLNLILTESNSPFDRLRRPGDTPFAVFVGAGDPERIRPEDRISRDAVICFCRTADCSELWPISMIDAYPDRDHPYACVNRQEDGVGQVFAGALAYRANRAALREGPRRKADN